ncbi:hypothetical protein WICANDRAFT_84034 [Wickerhamomyces anomalus NRRL Y-366-8]|uniref:Uncharacterized protein n=1 Tax=Wickerhamomyces anomalus (strain ATCC 58044 / CBS 1984 / NCYC 433 / NRRL Y-366-8) TaxID=683960 RepID=A0A1E3P5G6_WICAA|nr:uncharacterized protein WICANDRAFT_84034 [Wickerhamomyces anomalus NRRL Y-366-8]ODQ60067.1 hypothetical protein WICANDRAFT_84034 [Wickerhamomyces anomalus NRRL Y-366-8]
MNNSDPNGLCLTTSNTSSLVSTSSINTAKSTITNKFKNALNRKRSKSLISPETLEVSTLKPSNRNKSISSIQYSPTPSTIANFENQVVNNMMMNSRSNSTSSISDTDSTIDAPTTPISPLFKIDEVSKTGEFQNIQIRQNEEMFDSIADGILERISKSETQIDWSI